MGDMFAVGGCDCNCNASTMTVTISPYGCINPPNNSALFSGITVNIYDHSGGTLLASGMTGGSGSVVLSWSGAAGTYYITIPAPNARWTNYGASNSLSNGGTYALSMPTNAGGGYSCICSLDIPIVTTGWTFTDANGSHPLGTISTCQGNITPFPYGYTTSYNVTPDVAGSPTCVGGAPTKIFGIVTIAQTFVVNREYYVSSTNHLCYCDAATSCGAGGVAIIQSASSILSSIAIPISMTVTPSAVAGGYAPDPVGGNITVTE